MAAEPQVTVLMTVYNGRRYLAEAIHSVLGQTHTDFELLIINDGSTDDSLAVIREHSDPRIRVIDQHPNRGIHPTLNRGLAEARGRYVAIMDQDDLSAPHRLERQLSFLREHPRVAVCGSAIEVFGEQTGPGWVSYFDPAELKIALLFGNPLCHPSTMLDVHALRSLGVGYIDVPWAEEYALWVRVSQEREIANLPEPLLRYRSHPEQVSRSRNERQAQSMTTLMSDQLARLGVPASPRELILHQLLGSAFNPIPGYRRRLGEWCARLLAANETTRTYDPTLFAAQLGARQVAVARRIHSTLRSMTPLRRWYWRLIAWRQFQRAGGHA